MTKTEHTNGALRRADNEDVDRIWQIIQQAIQKRKEEGSDQWQDGYPNKDVISADIAKGYSYVLDDDGQVIVYVAIIFDGEPAYVDIEGAWITMGDYAVVHRLAVAQDTSKKALGTHVLKAVEQVCLDNGIHSIKVDTNHDNQPMLKVFAKLGYTYCGEVTLRGNARRKAFEKVLESE